MTKVDIFSGFLGAGKTTLIKKLIEDGAYGDEKIVLIENEFGEIGVDGGFLKDTGIEINQMDSGCICCSLAGDFGKALNKVISEFSPDRVLIEPSGVGKLSDVIIAVRKLHNDEIHLNAFTAVVDAKKCKMYMKNFGEFFNNQVESANSIILSHASGLSEEKLDACVKLLREHNKEASLVTTDWSRITGSQILQTMENAHSISEELQRLHEETRKEHRHDHENCDCEHEHHHHEHESCDCGHEHHHEHEKQDHDGHHHNHRCGHDHHHGKDSHHHHHADEIFDELGVETSHKFTKEFIENALKQLMKEETVGTVLRAKGIVEGDKGEWIHFDYIPGEPDVRLGSAGTNGMLCVIGANLKKDKIKEIFGL